jgi:hypothetical protein
VAQPTESDQAFPDGTSPIRTARLNKAWQYIATVMPFVFAQVPDRIVSQRIGQLPPELAALVAQSPTFTMEQYAAVLMQWFLNWSCKEYGLAREARTALPEALGKGVGLLWHELVDTPYGVIPGSFHESEANLLKDGDSERTGDCAFVVRVRRHPAWWLEQTYGVSADQIRTSQKSMAQSSYYHLASRASQGLTDNDEDGDVVTYYEVYSRMGLGWQLPDAPKPGDVDRTENAERLQNLAEAVQATGPNLRLVIVPGMKFPINLPPDRMVGTGAVAEIRARLEWPIPFHEDPFSPWPFSECVYHPEADNPWGVSPIRAGLPILRFLDNVYQHLSIRIRRSCRALVVTAAELDQGVKDAIADGVDLEMVDLAGSAGRRISEMIDIIEFPQVKKDTFDVLLTFEQAFEEITGLTPLLAGQTDRAMRSATEAQILQGHATSRPEYYAKCTEAWLSDVARKEAIAARLFVEPRTVGQLFREPDQAEGQVPGVLTHLWSEFVNTDDRAAAAAEWAYQVEAGGAQRKNREKLIADAQTLTTALAAPLLQFGTATGYMDAWNGLLEVLGKAMDTPLDKMRLPNFTPPTEEESQSGGQTSA